MIIRVQRQVLHIISGMNRGGIETWIMNVLRRIDTAAVRFDFLVETTAPADYDDEILAAGGRIFRCPPFRFRGRAARRLFEVLMHDGPYDVVHAHGRHDMGWPLSVAALARVPVRIGHVHNIKSGHERNRVQRVYKRVMKRVLKRNATWILGCSSAALASLYGGVHGGALEVLPYGIDVSAFTRRPSRSAVEREFEIPQHSLIAGHVGRFVWEKNHEFLIDIFAQMAARDPRWYLILVGDGRLRSDIEARVATSRLSDRVRFAGVRSDVPELMSAMDVFLFPSHIEGFGLVLVEAQALGVPCVLGEHLPAELDVYHPAMHRLSLDAGASAWARAAEGAVVQPEAQAEHIEAAHASVVESRMNIDRSVATLFSRYYGFSPGPAQSG